MALLKALCWALIFIIRIGFPPGTSLATVVTKSTEDGRIREMLKSLYRQSDTLLANIA